MPPTYRTRCPQCKHKVKYPEELLGRTIKCRECDFSYILPATKSDLEAAEPSSGNSSPAAPQPHPIVDAPNTDLPGRKGPTEPTEQVTAPAPEINWDEIPDPPPAPDRGPAIPERSAAPLNRGAKWDDDAPDPPPASPDRSAARTATAFDGATAILPAPIAARAISRIPPPAPPVYEEADEPTPTIDRSYGFRRRIEEYFNADISAPIVLLTTAAPTLSFVWLLPCIGFIIPVGLVVLAIALLIYQQMTSATDEEVSACIRDDRKALRQAALRRVQLHLKSSASAEGSVLPGWEKPLVFVGPDFVEKEVEDSVTQLRIGHDGKLRSARSNIMVIVLGTYQMITYAIRIDHRKGRVYSDSLVEYFYQDVVASVGATDVKAFRQGLPAYWHHRPRLCFFAQKMLEPPTHRYFWWLITRIVNPVWLGLTVFSFLVRKHRSEIVWETFGIRSAGTTSSEVRLAFHYVDNAANDQGALVREDSEEEEAVRCRIREVKSLLRREL